MLQGLLKSTAVVSLMTMISRILGFARDMVIANQFGASSGTDAFFVAFKIPNFLRRLFAEGAFAQAFVPVLSEYKWRRDHQAVRELIAGVSGTLGAILLSISLLAILAAPLLISLFAPGFMEDSERFILASEMLRLTFSYLFFISLTALAAGILNSYGHFALPAITPIWLNLSLITAALWLAPQLEIPIFALAWGVVAAGILQLLFQLPTLYRLNLLPRPRWGWHMEGVQRILKLMIPAIFGSSVAQINLLFDTIIASFLVAGSVSWLYYSDRLVEFPLGIFAIALATVILPSLSQRHAEANPDTFAATLDWGIRWVMIIGLPATLGLALLSGPLLATLFHYGAFTQHDLMMAQASLIAYSFGLTGFMLVKVLAPGYYARQDTRTPVRFGIHAMLANMALNLIFVVPMVIMGFSAPHAGLALATALAAFINAGQLLYGLIRQGVYLAQPGWKAFLLKLLIANAGMLIIILLLNPALTVWIEYSATYRITNMIVIVSSAIFSYFALLAAVGITPRKLFSGKM
jgi:putative peptidoglycan lipid II flippase